MMKEDEVRRWWQVITIHMMNTRNADVIDDQSFAGTGTTTRTMEPKDVFHLLYRHGLSVRGATEVLYKGFEEGFIEEFRKTLVHATLIHLVSNRYGAGSTLVQTNAAA